MHNFVARNVEFPLCQHLREIKHDGKEFNDVLGTADTGKKDLGPFNAPRHALLTACIMATAERGESRDQIPGS